jgi:hypothetical protein
VDHPEQFIFIRWRWIRTFDRALPALTALAAYAREIPKKYSSQLQWGLSKDYPAVTPSLPPVHSPTTQNTTEGKRYESDKITRTKTQL